MNKVIKIKDSDIHAHIKARMKQRGISIEEIQTVLAEGWNAEDSVAGTIGRVFVFSYKAEWEGKFFEKKEITVYYKYKEKTYRMLTAMTSGHNEFFRMQSSC